MPLRVITNPFSRLYEQYDEDSILLSRYSLLGFRYEPVRAGSLEVHAVKFNCQFSGLMLFHFTSNQSH